MDSNDLHEGARGRIFGFAKSLRRRQTKEEKILWDCLRGRRFNGFKFRRQHPLQNYIADFYCPYCRLVIEIDGNGHNSHEQRMYDEQRTSELALYGIRVIRFSNAAVRNNLDGVLSEIAKQLIPVSAGQKKS